MGAILFCSKFTAHTSQPLALQLISIFWLLCISYLRSINEDDINMSTELQKPVIGFSSGDLNGIGLEIIIKTLSDNRILEMCMPVVFANSKSINFYRKTLADANLNVQV